MNVVTWIRGQLNAIQEKKQHSCLLHASKSGISFSLVYWSVRIHFDVPVHCLYFVGHLQEYYLVIQLLDKQFVCICSVS